MRFPSGAGVRGCSLARRAHLSGLGPLRVPQVAQSGEETRPAPPRAAAAKPAPCGRAGSRGPEPSERAEGRAGAGGAGEPGDAADLGLWSAGALRIPRRGPAGPKGCGGQCEVPWSSARGAGSEARGSRKTAQRSGSCRWLRANSCAHLDRAGQERGPRSTRGVRGAVSGPGPRKHCFRGAGGERRGWGAALPRLARSWCRGSGPRRRQGGSCLSVCGASQGPAPELLPSQPGSLLLVLVLSNTHGLPGSSEKLSVRSRSDSLGLRL